jgi:DUF4097 and DUF4098 domain-containing protein YvlB
MKSILRALVMLTLLATPALAQKTDWNWRKAIPAGQTVTIRNIMGDIRASAATGNEVEIVARKRGDASDLEDVRIELEEHSGGVVVCVLYERDDDCSPDDRGHSSNRDNHASVEFEVRLPKGVHFAGNTVTGDVNATGLSGRVRVGSVSGDVRASTSDIASASTVSGSIHVRMGRADWADRLSFSTVSGDIVLEIAGDVNADVSMTTVSGTLESDWPVSMNTASSRQVRGRIGTGGRRLVFSTVSGSVELRRAQ